MCSASLDPGDLFGVEEELSTRDFPIRIVYYLGVDGY